MGMNPPPKYPRPSVPMSPPPPVFRGEKETRVPDPEPEDTSWLLILAAFLFR